MRILWLICMSALFVWANDELDDLFVKITTFERKGITAEEVQASRDPFDYRWRGKDDGRGGVAAGRAGSGVGVAGAATPGVRTANTAPARPKVLAVLNNKVKIGKKWIKLGGMYGSWKVVLIERKGVHLENATGEKRYYAIYEKNTKVIR